MRAGDVFDVQPIIILFGSFKRQSVILVIVFSDRYFRSVRCNKSFRLAFCLTRLLFCFVFRFKVAAFFKLKFDVLQIFRFGEFNLILNRFEIIDLFFRQIDLLRNERHGIFKLLISLEILLSIGGRRKLIRQGNLYRFFMIVIIIEHDLSHSAFDLIKIGR